MKEKINEKQWKYRERDQKQVLIKETKSRFFQKINKIYKLLERSGKRHDTN